MKLFENWKNLIEKMKSMSQKDIDAWRYLIMVLIIIDIFGVFWYLKLKTLGLALLIVLMGFFAFLLIVGGKDNPEPKQVPNRTKEVKPKMDEDVQEQREESKKQENEETQEQGMFDLGLGSSEEFQKRMDKALGTL